MAVCGRRASMSSGDLTCTDGQTYTGHRDPPGQAAVYISPGDDRKETYRLYTFRQFPTNCPVAPENFAKAGFYYTGFRDRVKCYSCGLCVEDWIVGDVPSDQIWHKSDCDFAHGRDTTNKPIVGFMRFLKITSPQRLPASVATNAPSISENNSPNFVISGGNFVQETVPVNFRNGNLDTSQNQHQQNLQQSPSPRSSVGEARPSSPSTAERTRELLYPCNHSVNPHFSSVIMRLESFKPRNGVRWPREKLGAGIDDLVNAGFFFLGEGDRVKCWYCNGGLQNWDYNDDPFTEHAKWFPSCEYVLRVKGPVFVENIVEQYPNLRRPTPTVVRPTPQPQNPPELRPISPPLSGPQVTTTRNPSPTSPFRSTTPFRPITPPLTPNEAVERAMTNLDYIGSAQEMGFKNDLIKEVLKKKYEANNQFYNTADEFLDALFAAQTLDSNEQQLEPPISQAPQNGIASAAGEETTSMLSQLQKLEETRLCKVCRKDVSNMVLIPCGHLSSCDKCARGLKKCPVCRRPVQESIKTFRA